MKSYFKFNLSGGTLFPIWICYLAFLLSPYISILYKFNIISPLEIDPLWTFPIILLIWAVAIFLLFYVTKLFIGSIEIKGQTFQFHASILRFVGLLFVNMILVIITLGIYIPWFIRNLHRFFSNAVSYNGEKFNFTGRGSYLLLIFILALMIPVFIVSSITMYFLTGDVFFSSGKINFDMIQKVSFVQQIAMSFVIIPYTYLFYNWLFSFTYKNYFINWETNFWLACSKIFVQLFLSVITLGLYLPMALLNLYKYFVERTIMESGERNYSFGFELEAKKDYIFVLKQILLSIVTLGFYYPWVICKVGALLMEKTYAETEAIQENENTEEVELAI